MLSVSERLSNTLIQELANTHAYGAADKLKGAGFEVLGYGSFGVVIEESNSVFKIFKADEVGYGLFVKYATSKRTVLLPRMEVVGTFGNWTVVQLEKLTPLRDVMHGMRTYHFTDYWKDYAKRRLAARGIKAYTDAPVTRFKCPKEVNEVVNIVNLKGMLEKMIDFIVENPQEGWDITWDLHDENFMLRDNGNGSWQLVLTDPWAAWGKSN